MAVTKHGMCGTKVYMAWKNNAFLGRVDTLEEAKKLQEEYLEKEGL
jgi:hypothetical protein